jgi:hypothetical protein
MRTIACRLGGIHFEEGDLRSRRLGRKGGRQVWRKVLSYILQETRITMRTVPEESFAGVAMRSGASPRGAPSFGGICLVYSQSP